MRLVASEEKDGARLKFIAFAVNDVKPPPREKEGELTFGVVMLPICPRAGGEQGVIGADHDVIIVIQQDVFMHAHGRHPPLQCGIS